MENQRLAMQKIVEDVEPANSHAQLIGNKNMQPLEK